MSDTQTIFAARNNTFVADSDLQAAFGALDQIFQEEFSTLEDKYPDAARRIQVELLASCSANLRSHLERIVQPVSDEAFYHYIFDQEEKRSISNQSSSSCDGSHMQKEDLDQFDLEDLLDQNAIQRVRQLRQAARDEAERLRVLRITMVERVMSLAKRQIALATDKQREIVRDSACASSVHRADTDLIRIEHHMSLLTASLNQSDRIIDSVAALAETVSNVQDALSLPPDASKTSQAIRERYVDCDIIHKPIVSHDRVMHVLGQ